MKLTPNFYRDRVCLNVLAGSKENASEIYEAAEGHVLVGVLSKNYPDVASAVADMREYAQRIDNALSVGLGAGDPNQSAMVSEISRQVQPQHVNQVFTLFILFGEDVFGDVNQIAAQLTFIPFSESLRKFFIRKRQATFQ